MGLAELIDKGGVVIIILIMLSIYVMTIIFFKAYQFVKEGHFDGNKLRQLIQSLKEGNIEQALAIAKKQKGAMGAVLSVAVACGQNEHMSKEQRECSVEHVGMNHLRRLESHLRGLDMVANVAPLLGLLGTVIGMVAAFSTLESAGTRVDPSLLAGGIWQALLTTVAGLTVGIPALAAYYIIDGRVEHLRKSMKEASERVLIECSR